MARAPSTPSVPVPERITATARSLTSSAKDRRRHRCCGTGRCSSAPGAGAAPNGDAAGESHRRDPSQSACLPPPVDRNEGCLAQQLRQAAGRRRVQVLDDNKGQPTALRNVAEETAQGFQPARRSTDGDDAVGTLLACLCGGAGRCSTGFLSCRAFSCFFCLMTIPLFPDDGVLTIAGAPARAEMKQSLAPARHSPYGIAA
jgi:hypothetical protein